MNSTVKIALYVFLAVLASVSGFFALKSFGQLMERSDDRVSRLEQIEPERKIPAEEPAPATNIVSTNVAAASNLVNDATNGPTTDQTTNPIAPATATAQSTTPAPPKPPRIGLWTALFVASLIGLGLLIANDVSHFFGNRALKTLYNEEGEGVANPEYEKAEEVWANGQHLEAISMMREYLKENPREQHVALRIAEIYEKDLGNYLAAALEYEEVLKHKLPPDRWGWAAIHLCNLYFKLNQEQKAYPLLRRIVNEHPTTPAADKARKRLEQVDGMSSEQLATEAQVQAHSPAAAPAQNTGGLPPGFRPRK
jgi:TolA-binding protein